ncbi:MAG: putative lipid kinase BmrU [Planctomycetota bacterium]|jgi:YegS/Rv2252/BmrU family lipid kinase
MRIALVHNPIAGRGKARAIAVDLESRLTQAGFDVRSIASARGDPADWLVPELDGVDRLIAIGGDGAVRAVAGACAARDIAIWHAPTGTENLFARAFGMSVDAEAIVRALRLGETRAIDLGDACGSPFTIMASVGFDAEVVHRLASERRGAITHLSYLAPVLKASSSWRATEVAWRIDDEWERLGRGMIVIANLPHYGVGLNPALDAVPDDGLLDAVFIPAERAVDLLPLVPLLRFGVHRRLPSLRFRRGRTVRIEASEPVRLQVDGDAVGVPSRSFGFRIAAEPLRIMVPARG